MTFQNQKGSLFCGFYDFDSTYLSFLSTRHGPPADWPQGCGNLYLMVQVAGYTVTIAPYTPQKALLMHPELSVSWGRDGESGQPSPSAAESPRFSHPQAWVEFLCTMIKSHSIRREFNPDPISVLHGTTPRMLHGVYDVFPKWISKYLFPGCYQAREIRNNSFFLRLREKETNGMSDKWKSNTVGNKTFGC